MVFEEKNGSSEEFGEASKVAATGEAAGEAS